MTIVVHDWIDSDLSLQDRKQMLRDRHAYTHGTWRKPPPVVVKERKR